MEKCYITFTKHGRYDSHPSTSIDSENYLNILSARKMYALRTGRYATFLILSVTMIGAFAGVTNVEIPSGKEYDLVCSNAAKENGVANPGKWVWSAAEANCVEDPDSGDETDTDGDDTSTQDDDNNALEARIGCYEGSLSKCLHDCGDFKPTGWKEGESGAWAGCRASCNFRCGTVKGGCYKGYCWASCATGVPIVEGHEWCYTTKGYSQDYRWVKCSRNDECSLKWKCAGPCAAF